jgi:hypothetical protein
MKTSRMGHFIKGVIGATLVGLITFTCVPARAAHEMIYAVDAANNLYNFWSDTPGSIINQFAINGVQNAEEIRGLDWYNGTIYGMGSFGEMYTINPNNGLATMVGSGFGVTPNGATFGADNDASGFRVVSGNGQNLLVDRGTGVAAVGTTLSYAAGDVWAGQSPRVDALAYDYVSGIWYAGDTLKNTLASFNPITGKLNTIGMLGIDAARVNGMDISPDTGIMYMGTPQSSSDPQANLYIVSKATGMVVMVGQIGNPGDDILVRGLTVVPIPEPSSVLLLALGAFGLLIGRRRQ